MIPNHSNTFDIIIIGGGPAGSAAAIYANKIGLKTIILDKSSFPRDKICGDALSGKSVRYMKELDLIDNVREQDCSIIKTITFGSPNHKQFNLHLENKSQTNNIKEGYVLKEKYLITYFFKKLKK